MQRRITGTEMEYSLLVQMEPREDYFAPDDSTDELFNMASLIAKYRPGGIAHIDQYLSNGSRNYIDVGKHIEYATPEDDHVDGTIANDIAGEDITFDTLENARQDGRFHAFKLNKRVIDQNGTTWGRHESFSADATRMNIDPGSLSLLGLHLATVSLFTGAGAVLPVGTNGEGRFVIAQKIMDIQTDFATSANVSPKPLVNLRNEPHADPTKYLRVHVASGDANMSPWAMRMRLGTIDLLLELTEHAGLENKAKKFSRDTFLTEIAIQVATDLTFKKTVTLGSGRTIRPISIQGVLIEAAIQLSEEAELSSDQLATLMLWEKAYNDFEKDPESLANRADWAAKKIFLEKFMARKGLDWSDARVARKDRIWDQLGPDGYGVKLRSTVWKDYMPSQELISNRRLNPPETTSALPRGKFIKKYSKYALRHATIPATTSVSWTHLKQGDQRASLLDPYLTSSPEIEAILG